MSFAFAGDVNFAERTAERLARNPRTAFGVAADRLRQADVTVVNLETAITEGGVPAPKQFHFRAPATAFTALAAAGVDIVSMANNHAADYGEQGVADSLAAAARSPVPVIGFGATASKAYAPQLIRRGGRTYAIFAASQVSDYTARVWTAGDRHPGIAVTDHRLMNAVRAAAAKQMVVLVFLHWGTEYQRCPNRAQRSLADDLAAAGAAAIVGTHAHVIQGAGWRQDGRYVAYGLGNYLWWRSFGNAQDDNGILRLTFRRGAVAEAVFEPARLDATGVPVPATGEAGSRILRELADATRCAGLLPTPPP